MKAAGWLAWRELQARKRQFVGSAALVAAAVALFSATELVSQAREAAVAAQMDFVAPSLRLTSTGVTSTQLARFELGSRLVPERLVGQLRRELSGSLRGAWGRLLRTELVAGAATPVIGMPAANVVGSMIDVARLGPGEVLIGGDLASRTGKQIGDRLRLYDTDWRVAGVLPPLGSAADVAVFMPLSALQRAAGVGRNVNEIRLYAQRGVAGVDIAARVRARHPELSAHGNADRDDTAEQQTETALRQHRGVVYALTALAVAIALVIAAYINAAERRVEMAMLVAMGGTTAAVLGMLVARAGLVGAVGAVAGYLIGACVAVVQDTGTAGDMIWSWGLPALVVGAGFVLSVLAAIPVSIQATYQNHVRALQE